MHARFKETPSIYSAWSTSKKFRQCRFAEAYYDKTLRVNFPNNIVSQKLRYCPK